MIRSLGLASLLVQREMRQGDLMLAAGRVRSKKKNKTKKKHEKFAPPKTHHLKQPGDRDHLGTARN